MTAKAIACAGSCRTQTLGRNDEAVAAKRNKLAGSWYVFGNLSGQRYTKGGWKATLAKLMAACVTEAAKRTHPGGEARAIGSYSKVWNTKAQAPPQGWRKCLIHMAEWTGLEPATPGVTGTYTANWGERRRTRIRLKSGT